MSPAQIQEQYRHIGFVRDYYQSGSETLYLGDGVMINCENGIDFVPVSEAKELIIQAIEKAGV